MKYLKEFKRGDTFMMNCYLESSATTDFAGYQIRSQIRDSSDVLIAELDVAINSMTSTSLNYSIGKNKSFTQSWPTGKHFIDIEFTDAAGVTTSSETMIQPVIADITR